MADSLISQLTFKELHLLPRAVFALGAFMIVWGQVKNEPLDSLMGFVFFFGAIAVNILYDLRRSRGDEETKNKTERRWLYGFCLAAFLFAALGVFGFIVILKRP